MRADDPLILTIDAGSSSVRATIHDHGARAVAGLEARRPYQFATTSDGGVEVGADSLFKLVVEAIDEVLARTGSRCSGIAAVAMSTFWHNLMGVDAKGRALTPVYSWADTRSAGAAEQLRSQVDESRYHARTGCPLHPSYLPAKLLWLYRSRPDCFRRSTRWMSFGEYAYLKLFGVDRCSLSMASGTGLLDQDRLDWDEGILQVLPLERNQLSALIDLDDSPVGSRPAVRRSLAGFESNPLDCRRWRRGLQQRGQRLLHARSFSPHGGHFRRHESHGEDPQAVGSPGVVVLSGRPAALRPGRISQQRWPPVRVDDGNPAAGQGPGGR